MAEFTDRVLKCVDCSADFIFTAGEQLFFSEKNFKNEPKRCKVCKAKQKQMMGVASQRKAETTILCSQCGREAKVPFKPAQGRQVYCHDCFQQRRWTSPTPGGMQ